MALVGLRPNKARLVMENEKPSVLVMKVTLDDDEAVELSTGGSLGDLEGVLRIRERRDDARDDGAVGSLVYVPASDPAAHAESAAIPAKFQVNVAMSADRFGTLLRVASAGRLPAKFFVDAGARRGAEAKALSHRQRGGARTKVWDNDAFRVLPVTNFVMILPIDVPTAQPWTGPAPTEAPGVSLATNSQVAEMMDDMLVFQSDTRTTMFGLVCVVAVVALAALAIGLGVFFR